MSPRYRISRYSLFFESERDGDSIAFNTFARSLAVVDSEALKHLQDMDQVDGDRAAQILGADDCRDSSKQARLCPQQSTKSAAFASS